MIYAENILICIAVPLLLSLLFVRSSARRLVAAVLVGMLSCLLAAYISGYLNLVNDASERDNAVFLAPIVEELLKCVPLLLYLLLFEPTDSALLVVAVGIGSGFATFENCCNLLSVGAASLWHVLVRGMAVGVMHIVSMTALCFGLFVARRCKALSASGVLGAVSLSVIFHGLYNLLVSVPGVSSYVGYLLPLVSAALLYLPYRSLRTELENGSPDYT